MKLISLYIENFGGLHQYSLDFSEGLTVIQEANGFGKTTLAEFIRAMFYGFPRKAKMLDKNRRQRYTPWQGGKFGGNLTFQLDGKDYRIERTFGATPKGDHFQLIDLATNKKSDRFSEEIGLEIFGLDGDSFERSTYMPQLREKVALSTDSIRAKLGDLVEDTGDVGNFEKAITALKTKRSSFIPYRGNGGSVGEASSRISQIQDELDRTLAREAELKCCLAEADALDASFQENQEYLAVVRKEITAASEMTASQAIQDQHRALENRLMQMSHRLTAMKEQYPAGIPNEEALEQIVPVADRQAALRAQNVTGPDDLAASRFLEENQSRFAVSVPTEAELEQCRGMLEDYRIVRAERNSAVLSQAELAQFYKYKEMQNAGVLDENRLEKLSQEQQELEKIKGLLESMEVPAEDVPVIPLKEISIRPAAILLTVGLAGMVAGIVLLVLSRFVAGGVILGAGLLGVVAGIFGAVKTMMARELEHQRVVQAAMDRKSTFNRKQATLEAQARSLESGLYRALGRKDYRQAVDELRLIRSRYLDLQEKFAKVQDKQQVLNRKMQETEKTVSHFLCRYFDAPEPEQFSQLLTELQRTAETCRRAKTTVEAWHQRKARREQELAECAEELGAFFAMWQIPMEEDLRGQLQQLRDDCRFYADLMEQKAKLLQELENFEQEYRPVLENPLPEMTTDLDELKRREEMLLAESSGLTRQMLEKRQLAQNLRMQLDRIPELQDQLETYRKQKLEGQTSAQLLDDTMEFLQIAKDNLSSNYLGPIQCSFREYLKTVNKEDDKVLITGDLDVQLERQGEARELGYFSAGQMDTVMLCMRFALVDALFTQEKPFVILDDPFVNLDDEHTVQALELLRTLSRERQILYLTCNSSRV